MRLFLTLLATLISVAALAQTPGFEQLPGGTEAQVFRREAASGRYAPRPLASGATDAPYASRVGQVLLVFVQYRTDRDSVLMDSRAQRPEPVPVLLGERRPPGTIEAGMSLLLPGDSAVFRFNADTVFAKSLRQPVPAFVRRAGNALRLTVVAKQLLTTEQMQARQQALLAEQQRTLKARAAKQSAKDNALIQAYLKKNKLTLKAKKTLGGTWYVITRRGTGALPKKGQTVSVKYRGTLLATGQEFDSSAKHGGTPFDFVLGQGQVIAGWDQGLAVLPKGSRAVLLVPSPLGYGERGAGADIPANAVLRFEVELVAVK